MLVSSTVEKLPPEDDDGWVEYKRILHNLSETRFTGYSTQMKWRMLNNKIANSKEQATYILGVDDDGTISGLTKEELLDSVNNLSKIADSCGASIIETTIVDNQKGYMAQIEVKKMIKDLMITESRIVLLGVTGSGKSTTVSVLMTGEEDDGDGSSIMGNCRHEHEEMSGKTSSVNYSLIGFDQKKQLINYSKGTIKSWKDILKQSDHVITLIDLPGDDKYFKTTLFGIMSQKPNFILITIKNIAKHNPEHELDPFKRNIILCIKLKIPFAIVVTNCDKYSKSELWKNYALIGSIISKWDMVTMICDDEMETFEEWNKVFPEISSFKTIPIIPISNVTLKGHRKLTSLLSIIPPALTVDRKDTHLKEFIINDIVNIPDVGTIIGGVQMKGVTKLNDTLLLGKLNNSYYTVKVKSIHRKQVPHANLYPLESGSLLVEPISGKKLKIKDYKSMMLISNQLIKNFTRNFRLLIKDSDLRFIPKQFKVYLFYCNNISQQIKVKNISFNTETMIWTIDVYLLEKKNSCYLTENDVGIIKDRQNFGSSKFIVCSVSLSLAAS